MKAIERPLDLLNASKNKTVMLSLEDGRNFTGTLLAFDIHINIVLDNTAEIIDGEQSTKLGITFFRGDSIIFVSPSK